MRKQPIESQQRHNHRNTEEQSPGDVRTVIAQLRRRRHVHDPTDDSSTFVDFRCAFAVHRHVAVDYGAGFDANDTAEQARVAADIGYPPVHAEALHLAGRLRLLRAREDDSVRGRALLLEAVSHAEASRHDQLAARIWNALTGLKALERPGLWNGSMAGWNTIFVEVPGTVFSPVKTVFDLLRPAHQPA